MDSTLANLKEAERKALYLFQEIENRKLIQPGKTEKQLNTEVFELAFELLGIDTYWHKRIVRAGKNTLLPYNENPPDLVLQSDDILFFDFGPIFEQWEADFGRTYSIGNDPAKQKLARDVETAWYECRDWFTSQKDVTGAQLYGHAEKLAKKFGWTFGGEIAGHLIGKFPHEKLEKEIKDNYVHPANHQLMSLPDREGHTRHWILEIHFVDTQKQIGGFFEQLLTN